MIWPRAQFYYFRSSWNRFQVDWNCAYAVYGQVEASFWLTGIAHMQYTVKSKQVFGWLGLRLCSIRSSWNIFQVDWNCACIKWSQVETSFRLTATALVLKEVKSNHIYSWPWLYYLQFKPGIAIFLLDHKCLNCSYVNCIT